jgi:hypothetical protein
MMVHSSYRAKIVPVNQSLCGEHALCLLLCLFSHPGVHQQQQQQLLSVVKQSPWHDSSGAAALLAGHNTKI